MVHRFASTHVQLVDARARRFHSRCVVRSLVRDHPTRPNRILGRRSLTRLSNPAAAGAVRTSILLYPVCDTFGWLLANLPTTIAPWRICNRICGFLAVFFLSLH